MISTALIAIVSMALVGSIVSLYSGMFSALDSVRIASTAQRYAEIEGNTLTLLPYDELGLAAHGKADIAGAEGWQSEVIVGVEKTIGDDSRQRIGTVKIYRAGEGAPRANLQVPLSSKGGGGEGVPVGTVITWPLAGEPDGADRGKWLECNGQAVDGEKYPKLAAKMSAVPDYRGVFLRGLGEQYSSHYNAVLHQSRGLGELQGDSIRNIIGSFGQHAATAANGVFYRGHTATEAIRHADPTNNSVNFDASLVVPTANENRPVNRAVRYFIRAA